MSTVEPLGTWQYAQTTCLPAGGARCIEETLLGEQDERPLGIRPAHASPSEAAISSMVPPTCTVAARRHRLSRQGMGPSRARSSLNTPGP